jgi:hypothetical protein
MGCHSGMFLAATKVATFVGIHYHDFMDSPSGTRQAGAAGRAGRQADKNTRE